MIESKAQYRDYVKADTKAMFGYERIRLKPFVGLTFKFLVTLRKCEYYTNCHGGGYTIL